MDQAHFTLSIGVGVSPELEKPRDLPYVGDMRAD